MFGAVMKLNINFRHHFLQAKQTKTVRDVLAPILQQYGWNINEVDVYVDEDTTIAGAGDDKVDLVSNVAVIDNKRLFLVQKSLEEIQKVIKSTDHDSFSDTDTGHTIYFSRLRVMARARVTGTRLARRLLRLRAQS